MSEGPYNLDDYGENGPPSAPRGRQRKSGLPPGLPEFEDPPERFAAWITEFARLDDDPVVRGNRWGVHGSEPLELITRSGREIVWPEQDHLFGARLQRPFVMVTGGRPWPLTPHDVQLAAWAIIRFCVLRAQESEMDEFHEWWMSYLEGRAIVPVDISDQAAVRATLMRWRQLADSRSEERPFVLVDIGTSERLVRRLDFTLHVRAMRGTPIAWPRLNGLARQAGWELTRIQFKATRGGAPYVDAKVFIVPAAWGEER
jgi:hypothetical protein